MVLMDPAGCAMPPNPFDARHMVAMVRSALAGLGLDRFQGYVWGRASAWARPSFRSS